MVKYFKQLTNSAYETKRVGKSLAGKLTKKKGTKALVLGLKGDLGGGKTTFLQGFANGLKIKQRVLSPTFVIMKRYQLPNCPQVKLFNFYHFDCYRINKSKEILGLGFKKIISEAKNIVAIEWAEKIKNILPKNTIWINFEFIDKNKRKIQIKNQF